MIWEMIQAGISAVIFVGIIWYLDSRYSRKD